MTTLHTFNGVSDGANPFPDLIQASDGNFYGTTGYGSGGYGTVFRMTPAGALTTLHTFANDADGYNPSGGVIQASDGNFYGANASGGNNNAGTAFKMTPAGALTTFYSFSGGEGSPQGGLVQRNADSFLGVAQTDADGGSGTIFQVTTEGVRTPLHQFDYKDGAGPQTRPVRGSDGNFYGVTPVGGSGGTYGTVYQLAITDHPAFFAGQAALEDGVYYLSFADCNFFGYYSYLDVPGDPNYLYHFDLGYEYVFDAADGKGGVYFYDFTSQGYFYSSPTFPFPYLYDFSLNSVVYYYPDPDQSDRPGRYNTDGYRFFYVFSTGQIISK